MTQLTIVAADHIAAGQELSIAVELQLDRPTKVKGIDVRVLGHEGWKDSNSGSGYNHRTAYIDERIAVHAGGIVPAGRHSFTTRVTIPADAPPTHDTGPAWAQLRLVATVHRSLLLPDLRAVSWSRVHRVMEFVQRLPATASADDHHVELGVASRRLVVGERIVGTLVPQSNDARTYVVQLVSQLDFKESWRWQNTSHAWDKQTFPIPAGSAGLPIPFALAISATATPSFRSRTQTLSWELLAYDDGLGTSSPARLSLELVELERNLPALRPAPAISDRALADAFGAFADANGWTPLDADRDPDLGVVRPAIARTAGKVTYELAYSFTAPGGGSVVARASFPTLGLGLRVTPSSLLREMLGRDVHARRADWDRHHRAIARFDDQAEPVVRTVVAVLVDVGHVGGLVRWTDHEIVFARVADEPPLAEIAAELERVVAAIVDATALVTPPPIRGELDIDGWRALAQSLGGRLAVGDLTIDHALLDGARVRVDVKWRHDEPVAIVAAVGPLAGASAATREIVFATGEQSAPMPQAALDEVARWPTDIDELLVQDGVATASRSYGPPAAAGELVGCLRRLIAALDPHDAYR